MELLIVTGMSGGGKGQALKHLEDLGYFCVDNMPPQLVPKLAELCENGGWVEKAAVVMDIRNRNFRTELQPCFEKIKEKGIRCRILFLDASTETLVNRFKQNRRMHPLSSSGERLTDAIEEERKILEPVKKDADFILDTTDIKVSELKDRIAAVLDERAKLDQLTINIISFGFKYGVPIDCDLMFDVRFIPNPFYFSDLKHLSGLDLNATPYLPVC